MKRKLLLSAAIPLVIIAATVVYFVFDPSLSALFPKCLFLMLTGFKCPGCGSQRAIHQLIHLNIVGALQYNALMTCAIPYILLLFAGKIVQRIRPASTWPYRIQTPAIIMSILVIVIVFWITRNIWGF
ncbi:MAG: DUF2752 domain-containing protein [Tannerella sp.]|jgi:hypothetical protein|nr:DUF2752 domain-containing protein [Tannerella sp.]